MGSAERMDGVWNLFHYYLFIIIALSCNKEAKWIRNLVVFSLIVSVLVAFRYILFYIGIPLNYFTFSFGNPGFFANYIVLHIPLAVWILATSKGRESRIALSLLILLYSAIIIHTGNRAAFLAWLPCTILLTCYFAFQFASQKKRLSTFLLSITFILIFGFGTLIGIRDTSFVKNSGFLQKITTWSLDDSTINNRLIMWNMAWKGILEKPIFGWGRDNFQTVFDKYYDPRFFVFETQEQWNDKAHNILLDELIAGGLINIIIEIAFILLIFGMLLKFATLNSEKRTFAVIFGVLIFMNIIQSMFTLNTLGIYLPITLAILVILAQIPTENTSRIKKKYIRVLCFICLPLFGGGIILYTLFPFLANYHVAQSLYLIPKNFSEFSKRYEKLDSLLGDKNTYKAQLMATAGMAFSNKADKYLFDPRLPPFQDLMLEKLSSSTDKNPYFTRLRTDYAFNLTLKAKRTKSSGDIQKAINVWEKLINEFPNHQFIKMGATGAYILAGDKNKAADMVYSIVNSSTKTGKMYWDSAWVLSQSGKEKDAVDFFTKSLQLGYKPNNVVPIVLVGNFLLQFPDKISLVRDLYIIAVSISPMDPNLHANLAYLYGKLGEKELAIKEARIALQYAPEHKADIEKFIKSLDQ
ncbi:O-antigen ligase family protein [Candidatus Peregrinibacteria bacterium]|nr:O-antigen ligase family protein [Candidatus Peregrinibacteria bacterium]